MTSPCSEAFRRLASELGGIDCAGAAPVVTLRSPADLANWTLPVVEALMVGGALLALAHAVARARSGDRSGLVLWASAVVYVWVLEPPLYFPQQLGIDGYLDVIFVHNVFTVTFAYDRMPLYIVALYPAGIYLAHAVVERLGVFARHGAVAGAATVGFVHHCFYEIFDNLGPQLRWWAWNPAAETNEPSLASVPLTSVVLFALVGPALLVFVWHRLVRDVPSELSTGSLVLRTLVVGVVTPLLLLVAGAPVSYLLLVDEPNRTAMAVLLYAAVAVAGVLAVRWIRSSPRLVAPPTRIGSYPIVHGGIHLAVLGALWLAALPGWSSGRSDGDFGGPRGSALYAAGCAAVCVWLLVQAARPQPSNANDPPSMTTRPSPTAVR